MGRGKEWVDGQRQRNGRRAISVGILVGSEWVDGKRLRRGRREKAKSESTSNDSGRFGGQSD